MRLYRLLGSLRFYGELPAKKLEFCFIDTSFGFSGSGGGGRNMVLNMMQIVLRLIISQRKHKNRNTN